LIRHGIVTIRSSAAKSLEICSELTPFWSSSWHLPQIGCGVGTWRKPSPARAKTMARAMARRWWGSCGEKEFQEQGAGSAVQCLYRVRGEAKGRGLLS
jgi:hypothetical protein